MTSFFRKLSWLVRRRRREAELEEELRFHLDEEAEQRQAEGLTDEQARWAARRDLGSLALVQENTRATWGWTALQQLGQDLRYAFRTMASNRLFTLLAVMSLALGIGANTAIYSFMDWILMRSLPVHDPDSLVVMNWRAKVPRRLGDGKVWHSMSGSIYGDPKQGLIAGIFPYPVFDLFQGYDPLFSSVFAFCPAGNLNLTAKGYSDLARSEYVTGDYFRGLGVSPAAGRLLIAEDDRAGAPAAAVISYALSQRRFGSAEAAPGQSIRETVRQADSRVPVANMITQAAQVDQTIHQEIAFAKLCTAFALLALLIACVGLYGTVAYNVARRTSEIGIRIALGAQRSSVVLQVLREVFVLAVAGLAISVPAALSGSKFVESFLFGMKPNDPLAVALAAVTLLAAALAAGYVPARKASRIDPMIALRHE